MWTSKWEESQTDQSTNRDKSEGPNQSFSTQKLSPAVICHVLKHRGSWGGGLTDEGIGNSCD